MKSCGAVIFRALYDEHEFLLLKNRKYYDFPKGQMEDGENPTETAIREIKEETSLENVIFIKQNEKRIYTETEPYGKHDKVARYYLCFVHDEESKKVKLPVNDELGRPEHDKFLWVDYETAHGLFNDRLRKVLNWAQKNIIKGKKYVEL
jgi:bis(5'-nucleosidyl)-tetraphosphatase